MDLNALKCIQIHIPQKGQTNAKMVINDKKCQKITNNCKISEIIKYSEQITTIDTNVKQCKTMTKMGLKRPKNGQISEIFFHRFSGSKLPKQMELAVFTRCLVPDTHFRSFLAKIRICGSKFRPNQ